MMTKQEFESRLKAAGAFWFDWTWSLGGDEPIHEGDDLIACDGVTPDEEDYVARVREAQEAAAEAIEDARAAYAAGDLPGALEAVQRACYEEARFGDCPTYMGLRDYLDDAVAEEGE